MQKTANDLRDFSRQNQVGILGIQICQAALNVFVSIFLVARILEVTNGNFGAIGLFLLVQYVGIIVTFWLFSYIVKKFSHVWCIRVSTLFLLGSIVMILLMQDNLAESFLLLSAVYGIGQGIYWCSIHTFTSKTMGGKKMASYAAWYVILTSATAALTPFTLGAIIEFVSFEITVIILCQAGYMGFKTVTQTELEKARLNLMSDFGAEQFHTESLLFTEIAYFLARAAACALIIAAFSLGIFFFQILVVVFIATVPISAILLHLWTKKYLLN